MHFYGLRCTTFPSGALPHFPPTRVRRSPTCHRQFSVDGRDHRPRPLDASAGAFVWPHGAAIKSARCPPANIRQGEILPRMPAGRGRHRNGGLRALGACALRSVIGLRLRLQRFQAGYRTDRASAAPRWPSGAALESAPSILHLRYVVNYKMNFRSYNPTIDLKD